MSDQQLLMEIQRLKRKIDALEQRQVFHEGILRNIEHMVLRIERVIRRVA